MPHLFGLCALSFGFFVFAASHPAPVFPAVAGGLFADCGHPRKFLTFHIFQQCAAARRDIRHLVC